MRAAGPLAVAVALALAWETSARAAEPAYRVGEIFNGAELSLVGRAAFAQTPDGSLLAPGLALSFDARLPALRPTFLGGSIGADVQVVGGLGGIGPALLARAAFTNTPFVTEFLAFTVGVGAELGVLDGWRQALLLVARVHARLPVLWVPRVRLEWDHSLAGPGDTDLVRVSVGKASHHDGAPVGTAWVRRSAWRSAGATAATTELWDVGLGAGWSFW